MTLSYSAAWAETLRMLRSNQTIAAAIAGVFLLLPALLTSRLLPPPQPAQDLPEFIRLWSEYFWANWHWLLLARLANLVGAISLLLLFLEPRESTVGGVIATAASILPFYFVTYVAATILIAIGFALLILPGLYLIGRVMLYGPVMIAEGVRSPVAAISRSFELSRGNGWAVLGLYLLVGLAGAIVVAAIGMLLGILFLLVAGQDIGTLLTQIVRAIGTAALGLLMVALGAAIYRQLKPAT